MCRVYNNHWIPRGALEILLEEKGSILDVGGGSSPYARSEHILDIGEYSDSRLNQNCWDISDFGTDASASLKRKSNVRWSIEQYTQFDLCCGKSWPFADRQFSLGLCSHTLEELPNPLHVIGELCRVSKKVLIICPSRLLEQTMGADHPRFCGFRHHLWMVAVEDDMLVFRRKTDVIYMRGCHIRCPLGKTLSVNAGAMFVAGKNLHAEERIYRDCASMCEEHRKFLDPYRGQPDIFVHDGYRHNLKYLVWRLRQVLLNVP